MASSEVKKMTIELYRIPTCEERDAAAIIEASEMLLELSTEIERLRAIEGAAKVLIAEVERTGEVTEWFRPMAALREVILAGKEGE